MNDQLRCTCFTEEQKRDLERAARLVVSAVKFKRGGYIHDKELQPFIDDLYREADKEIKRFDELHKTISDIPICPI